MRQPWVDHLIHPKRAVGDHVHAVFSDICWTSGLIRRYEPVFVFMATTSQQRDFVSELCMSSWSDLSAGLSWGSRCRCCLRSWFMEWQLFVLWLICICAALWDSIIFCFALICDNTPRNNNVGVARSRQATSLGRSWLIEHFWMGGGLEGGKTKWWSDKYTLIHFSVKPKHEQPSQPH